MTDPIPPAPDPLAPGSPVPGSPVPGSPVPGSAVPGPPPFGSPAFGLSAPGPAPADPMAAGPAPVPAPVTVEAPKKSGIGRSIAKTIAVRIGTGIVGLAVVAGVGAYLSRDDVINAKVGDCVTEQVAENPDDRYKLAGCDDPATTLTVLAVQEVGVISTANPLAGIAKETSTCLFVPGASQSWTLGQKEICLGEKGVDVTRSINDAEVGDCLAVVGNDVEKTPCSAPDAEYEVLEKLTGVISSLVETSCGDVAGAEASYEWSWTAEGDDSAVSAGIADVVLCLGAV